MLRTLSMTCSLLIVALSCLSCYFNQGILGEQIAEKPNISTSQQVPAGKGVMLLRVSSNRPATCIKIANVANPHRAAVYIRNVNEENDLRTFVVEPGTYFILGAIWVAPLGQETVTFQSATTFEVGAGQVNYVGDLAIIASKRKASWVVKDRSAETVTQLNSTYPQLSLPVVVHLPKALEGAEASATAGPAT